MYIILQFAEKESKLRQELRNTKLAMTVSSHNNLLNNTNNTNYLNPSEEKDLSHINGEEKESKNISEEKENKNHENDYKKIQKESKKKPAWAISSDQAKVIDDHKESKDMDDDIGFDEDENDLLDFASTLDYDKYIGIL